MTAGVRLQWVPVDPGNAEQAAFAARLNAAEAATDADRRRRSRRYIEDAALPHVRLGYTDCVYRHEGGCLFTRLRGGDVEVGWTRDGDVWRCSRFGLIVPVADVPQVPDAAPDVDRLCAEAIRATWDLDPHARLALALATARDAGHAADDVLGRAVGHGHVQLADPQAAPVPGELTGVRAALTTLEAP